MNALQGFTAAIATLCLIATVQPAAIAPPEARYRRADHPHKATTSALLSNYTDSEDAIVSIYTDSIAWVELIRHTIHTARPLIQCVNLQRVSSLVERGPEKRFECSQLSRSSRAFYRQYSCQGFEAVPEHHLPDEGIHRHSGASHGGRLPYTLR